MSGPSLEDLLPGFNSETTIEAAVVADPMLLRGLAWGEPRRAHPEGTVARHVTDLLATIEAWGEQGAQRADLRLVTLVHDSFKFAVTPWRPRTGENHHAVRAQRFAERHTGDERVLATIELHDRPYALWRRMRLTGRVPRSAVDRMLERVPDTGLFTRFVQLDASTEGKRHAPVEWLLDEVAKAAPSR